MVNLRHISLVISCLAAVLAGCSHQDFGRPIHSPLTDMLKKPPDAEKLEQARLLDRQRKFAKALADWQLMAPEERPEYHIGVDDVIKLEIQSFETPGKASVLIRTVGNDGMVNLAWAGKVKIAGLNVPDAEKAVIDHLSSGYIKNPTLTLSVVEHKSAGVVITGAVSKPGVYYLKRDRRSLLEVLAQADGLDLESGDELYLIRGKKSMQTILEQGGSSSNNLVVVNLKRLVDEGDLDFNTMVQGGDIIKVLPRKSNYIFILGYVNRPGTIDIANKGPVSALDAVALAGGINSMARAENSWILRNTERGQKTIPVDLTAMARGALPPLYMKQGDTLVVGSSTFAKLSEFIKVGGSVGANYSPVGP